MLWWAGLGAGLLCCWLAWLWAGRGGRPAAPDQFRTCLVLGSGGHTAEMLRLAAALDPARYTPRLLVLADNDSLSRARAAQLDPATHTVAEIPRARAVGQECNFNIFGQTSAGDRGRNLVKCSFRFLEDSFGHCTDVSVSPPVLADHPPHHRVGTAGLSRPAAPPSAPPPAL